ncbi:MAG: amino acid ABC transporter substrate-binding protein [Alphaproteobacteria bacterium]|nr:MAG: amino acid ABC transporter substrate-binding protein [Alphaproteobacteria bacterium]
MRLSLSNLTKTICVSLTLMLASCGQETEQEPGIVLAAIYNTTGAQSNLDGPSSQGLRLAIDQANAAGGVLGMPVNLVMADGTSDPSVILQRAESLFNHYPQTSVMVGLSDTDMVMAAAPTAAQHGLAFITSGATSPKLPREVPGHLFLACFGDNVQAAAGAEFAINTLGTKKAIVLFNETMSYTQMLHQYFGTRFTELGGEVTKIQPYNADTIPTVIARLAQELAQGGVGDAGLIYLAAGPDEVVQMLALLRRAGINTPVLGGDGLDIGESWAQLPVSDVYFTTHAYLGDDTTDPDMQAFIAAYEAAYPGHKADAFSALGFDTANLVMQAIADAGSPEPEAVRTALANIQNFKGLTGTMSFGEGNYIPRKSVSIIAITGGVQSLAAEIMPESVPAP